MFLQVRDDHMVACPEVDSHPNYMHMMERAFKTIFKSFDSLVETHVTGLLVENHDLFCTDVFHPFTGHPPGGYLFLANVHQTSKLMRHAQPGIHRNNRKLCSHRSL